MKDLFTLPDDLPIPIDDGACAHLPGIRLPSIPLATTSDNLINVGTLPGSVVLYFYPMTGRPDSPPMVGWNEIPGARGCTPQTCGFRDHHSELKKFATHIFGVSAQPIEDQKEAKNRLRLPFELINDGTFTLTKALRLPTFEYQGTAFIKRLTVVAEDGVIRKVFYPVFPPNRSAEDVIEWFGSGK